MKNRIIAAHLALALAALIFVSPTATYAASLGELAAVDERGSDDDGDGIDANSDNCINTFNPDQRDSDGDGFGNICDADLNDDCIVNVVDLGLFRTRFFTSDADADLNGNGVVNVVDLGVLRTLFFLAPGPSGQLNVCDLSVAASGELNLNRSLGFDLDQGLEQTALTPPVDIWYQALSATSSNFNPRNSTRIGIFGLNTPSAQDCNTLSLSQSPIALANLTIGSWLCVRTNEDRVSRFQIISANGSPLNTASAIRIDFTTWE